MFSISSSRWPLRLQAPCSAKRVGKSRRTAAASNLNSKVITSVVACSGAALADPLMSLVDTAFVGHLGVLQLAALGPNAALFNVIFFLGFSALGVVSTNQISSAHGHGDSCATGNSLILASIVSLGIGLAITAVLLCAPCRTLQFFQTNAEMMPYAKVYCVIRALGVAAALLMVVFQSAFRALEDMNTPLLVVAASGLLNAILDPILIYPLGMGIAGAAWATTISQIAGAATFAAIIAKRRNLFGLPAAWENARETASLAEVSLATCTATIEQAPASHAQGSVPSVAWLGDSHSESLPSSSPAIQPLSAVASTAGSAFAGDLSIKAPPTWRVLAALMNQLPVREFVGTCTKLAVRCVLVLSTWTLSSIAATRAGTYTMAAYQIMQQVLQLQLSVCWAFLVVGQSLVGVMQARMHKNPELSTPTSHGSGKGGSAQNNATSPRAIGDCVIRWSVLVSVVMAAGTWALRGIMPRLFTSDPGVLALAEGTALCMCLMLAISWNNAVEGVLIGAGDTQFVIDIYPMCVGMFALVLGSVYLAGMGLYGIWMALFLYYVGLTGMLGARYWIPSFRSKI